MKNAEKLVTLALVASLVVTLGAAGCRHAPLKDARGAALPPDPADIPPPQMGHNLLFNGSFSAGVRTLPWTASFSAPAEGTLGVDKGELCLDMTNKGTNRWDVHFRHQHLLLQKGHVYTVQFKMRATKATRAYLKVGQAGPPYHEYWKLLFNLDEKPHVYSGTFTMEKDDDPSVEVAFHIGGQLAKSVPMTVCLDDARLDDPKFVEKPESEGAPIPNVLVNQLGYFPQLTKLATVKVPSAVPWELRNGRGEVVAQGTTIPFGPDKASGDQVSIIDFSAYTQEGSGYTLKVGRDQSHPFDIRDDLYRKLKYDALAFFYQQRSGIPIEMPYAGGAKWVRPAGHIGVLPNHGDKTVPCATGSGCTYSLDVSGGWYDAGDQGKYVVNAGISVWTLLNWWERLQYLGASAADFADGKMNIPENKNGVPDLLDEARWELEFELRMQVPEGEKLAGMAHHKIHDIKWTQLSMGPHEDPMERFLQPPSTAATLNLAANGAQCARVWRAIDKAFADKCLVAAERAWAAAQANPDIYAPPGGDGGGGYDDGNVSDEFYWAATELYITTKKPDYKELITKSEHFKLVTNPWNDNPGMATSMTWGDTRTLASLSLAIVPSDIGADVVTEIKKNVVAVADSYLDLIHKGGYRVPFGVPIKGYPWGSSSFVLNNGLMMALANDFTREVKYVNGAVAAMDYVLGRNGLDQSYVTGYGSRPLENPYHRFWCHQANDKYPPPPPGVLSGGPNSELQDPYVQAAGLKGCAPQKCFMDHGEAWSTNEVTINWNAPLAWLAAYLDEQARPKEFVRREAAPAEATKAAIVEPGKPQAKAASKSKESKDAKDPKPQGKQK